MKIKTIITLFISIMLTCGFSYAQGTLQVTMRDCRVDGDQWHVDPFKLFRNDSLIMTLDPQYIRKKTIGDLPFGKYEIQYTTVFERTESIQIEIHENRDYPIELCPHYFDHAADSYIPIIDQLANRDSYSIEVSMDGCFNSTIETYTIRRKRNKYYILFKGKEKLLALHEIEAIRHFEIELNHMESEGCSSIDTYIIKYKKKEIKITDGSCLWGGDSILKEKLNLSVE